MPRCKQHDIANNCWIIMSLLVSEYYNTFSRLGIVMFNVFFCIDFQIKSFQSLLDTSWKWERISFLHKLWDRKAKHFNTRIWQDFLNKSITQIFSKANIFICPCLQNKRNFFKSLNTKRRGGKGTMKNISWFKQLPYLTIY